MTDQSLQPVPLMEQIKELINLQRHGLCNTTGTLCDEYQADCDSCQAGQILALSRIAELLKLLEQAGGDLSKMVVLDGDQEPPEPEVCQRCEGEGLLYADGKAHYYSDHAPVIPCGACGGTGKNNLTPEELFEAGWRRIKQPEATDTSTVRETIIT